MWKQTAVAAFLLFSARNAHACSCANTTPLDAARQSGIAYVGEVVATGTATVEVRVVDAILGVSEGEVHDLPVNVGPSAGCGTPYPFLVGQRWIFFGTETDVIGLCSKDQPEDDAVVRELHQAFDDGEGTRAIPIDSRRARAGV